jgi:hypothetical protein
LNNKIKYYNKNITDNSQNIIIFYTYGTYSNSINKIIDKNNGWALINENKHRIATLIQSHNNKCIFYNNMDENNQVKMQEQIFNAFKNIINHCLQTKVDALNLDLEYVNKILPDVNIMINFIFKQINIKLNIYNGQTNILTDQKKKIHINNVKIFHE